MENYIRPLITRLEQAANPQKALWAEKYLKNQYKFLGLSAPAMKEIFREFFKQHGLPEITQLEELVLYLWDKEEREFQHSAVILINKMVRQLRKEDIFWIEKLIISKSWWDTVDGLATWICAEYFKKYPEMIPEITESWMNSGNLWLQRTVLIFQVKYKKDTDTDLLAKNILRLADHKDFFIRKAIGWILREYSKTDKKWVRTFVDNNNLSSLSVREATKYC